MIKDNHDKAWNNGLNQAMLLTLDAMTDLGGIELKNLAHNLSPELADPDSNFKRFLGELYDQSLLDAELSYAAEAVNDQDRIYVICPTRKKQKELNFKRFNDVVTLTKEHFLFMEEYELVKSIDTLVQDNSGVVTYLYHFYDYVMFTKRSSLIDGND